jgi:DNA-binding winged helix-turn-helix (wHTH) protein
MATAEAPGRQPIIRFLTFELDRARQTLSRDGVPLKLQRHPLQILELLISRAPEVVTVDQIRRQIWGDEVHVDAAQSIRFCIRQIRAVLDDDSAAPRFVETLPKQGYRFIAPLEAIPGPAQIKGAVAGRNRRSWVMFGLLALAAVALVIGIWEKRSPQRALFEVTRISPITTYPDNESRLPFRPMDGRWRLPGTVKAEGWTTSMWRLWASSIRCD